MFERSLYDYINARSAPFGFLLRHRSSKQIQNPLDVIRGSEVKILFDPFCELYLLEGPMLPWFCPIPKKHVHNLANAINVHIHRTPSF